MRYHFTSSQVLLINKAALSKENTTKERKKKRKVTGVVMNGLGITQLTQKGEQVLCACPPGLFLGKMPHLHKGHKKAKLMYGTRVTRVPLLAGEKGEIFGELLMRGGQRWAASYLSLALKLPPTAWGQQDADQ